MKKQITILTLLTLILFSCGEEETKEDKNTDDLLAKKEKLTNELNEINQKLADLDTTKSVLTPLVTFTSLVLDDYSHKIEIQGQVETDQNILINSETNGVIRQIHVKEGQKVSQGQALITIDSEILQNNIVELETSLEIATFMLEKQEILKQQGLGTEIEYEQAKNQKKSLEKRIQTLKSQKGKSVVRAPFSGVIDQIFTNNGEMAMPQAPLLRLVNNSHVKITASVVENYLAKVKKGTDVDIIFPDLDDTVIQSKITYIGNFIDPVNRTFRIQIDIAKNTLLLPNQVAKVNITDLFIKDALILETNSILQDTDNNNFVYKLIPNKNDTYSIEKIFIKIISSYNGRSAIEALNNKVLSENDKIVLKGGKGITEKDIVKIQ